MSQPESSPLTVRECIAAAVAVIAPFLALAIVGAVCGCASTPSGMKVTATSATYTNIGDINWDEYKIPVLSLYLGPRATVWVNKDYKAIDEIVIRGAVTNTTTALAIYDSKENKTLDMCLRFRDNPATNDVPVAASK